MNNGTEYTLSLTVSESLDRKYDVLLATQHLTNKNTLFRLSRLTTYSITTEVVTVAGYEIARKKKQIIFCSQFLAALSRPFDLQTGGNVIVIK
jgi:hypothetical protein